MVFYTTLAISTSKVPLPLLQHWPHINLINPSPTPLRVQPPINLRDILTPNTRLLWLPLYIFLRKLDVYYAVNDCVRDVHTLRTKFLREARGKSA